MSGLPESGHDWAIYEYNAARPDSSSLTAAAPAQR
jgi:hypothetical protein